jgi:CheY-like chemotaxis protein
MTVQPAVLLAEDDDGHAMLTQQGLKQAGFHNQVLRFRDGQEVLEFLTGGNRPAFPMVLLLDISMPKLSGIEVLRLLRGQTVFKSMPIIMVTTNDDPEVTAQCAELGCNAFLFKLLNQQEFATTLSKLAGYFSPVDLNTPA